MTMSQHRYFKYLHCLLIFSCVASSSLPSTPVSVSSPVGSRAILPCHWKSTQDSGCHIQWQTPDQTVFEQKGEQHWQASGFEGRVEVPQARLAGGDCSLVMRDVQFGDVGVYESFIMVDGAGMQRRKFIQSVQLSVHDHKSKLSLGVGEHMTLQLHTPQAVRVVFHGGNATEWAVLWMKGEEKIKGQPEEAGEELIFQGLTVANSGTYKVLDAHGRAVSTVQLTVEKEVSESRHVPQIQSRSPVGAGGRNSLSPLSVVVSLLFGLSALQLL